MAGFLALGGHACSCWRCCYLTCFCRRWLRIAGCASSPQCTIPHTDATLLGPNHPNHLPFSHHLQLVFVENTADDPSRRKPDITKAKTLLGWQPKVGWVFPLCTASCCLLLHCTLDGHASLSDGLASKVLLPLRPCWDGSHGLHVF